ncbi:ribonuclease [Neorhizobium sp. P12A]|nr:ribonuclease [Neorhizobium sp. P12A]
MKLFSRGLMIAVLCLPMLAAGAFARDAGGGRTRFILAASWEPAFCATNQKKTECRGQKAGDFDATNFSLHGLWPMRQEYCGVSDDQRDADRRSDWNDLPAVSLTAQTRSALDKVMPGTQSGLERHEWTRHGSCTGMSADDYFNAAVGLINELNASAVRDLFAQNIGKTLDAETIKAAFDESFGNGASDRVKMSCRRVGNVRVISEITIGLSADATQPSSGGPRLGKLIQEAGRTSFGCNQGVVDAAGF